ncbi:alpha/beta fold hydrolase [Paucibacter sp. APW11]|uniref:Alpha/beta fold hydrolase n=1 Tax=Roseateles aquae TaxID=3077235 RepID=A0ABU3PII2_9BURK|nr:alpha/beta fold hydrolase [Paucibacter sp. APW11]MDT9002370.1 alpha/beta fold hydrolase [Paucibacter sp. APW11]
MRDWLMRQALRAARRRAGLNQRLQTLPWGRLVYHSAGEGREGTPLLLLHGACADHSSWLAWLAALRWRGPVLVPDLPGHGESTVPPDADLGISAQTERMLDWLDSLAVRHVHLIAHSMGGAIAIRLAALRPALVRSLTLISSAGAETQPSELRRHVERGHPHPMVEVDSLPDYRAMLAWGMAKPPYLPGFVQRWLLAQKQPRRTTERKLLRDLARDQDQRALLGQVKAPTLLLWGELDRVVHVADAATLASGIANSRITVLPQQGHVPMVEAAAEVAQRCREFLFEVEAS